MSSRSRRDIQRVDYKSLNSVGFVNSAMSNSGEESNTTQSESEMIGATGCVCELFDGDVDPELSQLRQAVAEKESEKQRLIENEKKKLRAQLNKSAHDVAQLQAKKQKQGTKSEITINSLRKDKKLRSKVAAQLKKLTVNDSSDSEYDTADSSFSSGSDAESESDSDYSFSSKKSHSSRNKKHKKSKSKKSGIKSKASDKVRFPQRWPHANLQFEYVNKNVAFQDLSFALLVAGELEIISDSKSEERKGRTALLRKIAYYTGTYSTEGLKNFYSACVRQVEKGEKTWADDFSNLEQPILSKHLLPVNKMTMKKKFSPVGTQKANRPDDGSERTWFCSLYNRNKCMHKTDHTLVSDNGQMKYASHICAACWQADKKKLPHPECSKECPHSTTK